MHSILPTLLLLSLCAGGCRKHRTTPADNPYGLSNATQTGANIVGCRINGINWMLKKINSNNLHTSWSYSNDRLPLTIAASGTPTIIADQIAITINSEVREGATYSFKDTTQATASIFRLDAPCGATSGYGGAQWTKAIDGSVTITRHSGSYRVPTGYSHGDYDEQSIIAGVFNFVIAIPGCDSIKVTDGRFDINYSLY